MVTLHTPVRPRRAPSVPVAILIEPSAGVAEAAGAVLTPADYRVEAVSEEEAALDTATLVLVEADRGARAIRAIKRIHAERPDLPVVAVLPWWDEDEREVLHLVRFVLHVPLRDDQLRAMASFVEALIAAPARA